jgi:hypothetical protein
LVAREFIEGGTNERAQFWSRHRLEGPAEIRVSRSNTGQPRTPTDHYAIPCDSSHRRASYASALRYGFSHRPKTAFKSVSSR